jgi:hypothetical protein
MQFKLRLYELPAAFMALQERIEESGGELSEFVEMELDGLEANLETKVDAIACLIDQANAESDLWESRAKKFTERRKVAANRATRLKDYLKTTLTQLERTEVKGVNFKVKLQNNPAPAIAWAGDPDEIPKEFQRVTISLDGDLARQAFKDQTLPDGFTATVGTHIRIT